jgi:hypothetical protein
MCSGFKWFYYKILVNFQENNLRILNEAKKGKRGILRFTERKLDGDVTTAKVGRARLRAHIHAFAIGYSHLLFLQYGCFGFRFFNLLLVLVAAVLSAI